MFGTECYKLLFKQKLLILLLLFFISKVIIMLYSGYDSEVKIERNPQGYIKYIKQYEGKLTEEVSARIDEEYEKVNISHSKIYDLQFKKSKGQIADEEYKSQVIDYYERQKNYDVFQVFYSKYFYAKEKPEERYIMDNRGWNTLLNNNNPDYLLIFCLIIVLSPIFCYEYECDMDNLILSMSKGKHEIAIIKMITGTFFAILITLLFSIIECVVVNYMVGLNNFLYPIQSLISFKDCVYQMTIIEVYIYSVGFRMIGAFMLFGFISVLSVTFKKINATLFITSLIILIPFIVIKNRLNLFYLPIPSGWFLGNKFLSDIQNIQDSLSHLVQLMDINIQNQTILYNLFLKVTLIVGILIAVILFSISKKLYSKSTFKLRTYLKKMTLIICIIIPLSYILFGFNYNRKSNIYFNACLKQSTKYGETKNYNIYFDIIQNKIIARNKATNEDINVLRNPINLNTKVEGIFVKNDWCYYLEREIGKSGFRIYEVDLNSFAEKLVYNSVSENIEDFFGFIVGNNEYNILETMVSYLGFYLDDNYIYYFDFSNNLVQINRFTKNEKVIAIDVYNGLDSYFYNGDLYYTDTQARLCWFDSKSSIINYINNIYTNDFKIENNQLIYKDLLDNNNLKTIDLLF